MKVLYVDDIRFPEIWHINNANITVCRNYKEAIEQLADGYDVIDLDHDLGEEKTGYDICKYIIENNIKVQTIVLHTSNPVGRDNMKQLLERYTKSRVILM